MLKHQGSARWKAAWRGLFLVLAAAAPAIASAPPPFAVSPSALVLHYDLYASGIPVMNLDVTLDEVSGTYDMVGQFRASGLFGLLSAYTQHTASHGVVAAGEVRPAVYDTESVFHGGDRRAHLDYPGDGRVVAALNPPEDPAKPAPSPQQITGTVDPLTAILAMSHAIARAGNCATSTQVYDGRRRYDLVLADAGPQRIEPSSAYAGMARRCTVDMVKIAGFSFDRGHAPPVNHGTLWIAAPRPGALPLPVRLDFASDWGWISVRLAQADARLQTSR